MGQIVPKDIGGVPIEDVAQVAAGNVAIRQRVERLVETAISEMERQLKVGTPDAKVKIASSVLPALLRAMGDTEAEMERRQMMAEWEEMRQAILGDVTATSGDTQLPQAG